MEDKKPLLSICIPTYNRDYIIKECLNKLCPITHKYNVQIHISDNASPDDTENVVKEYMNQYDNIFYYRQNENIGPDRNYEFILKQPDTEYRWLFGDYAFVSEDNLKILLEDLSNYDFDIYVIGGVNRTELLNEKIYTSRNALLSELGWHITWISCLIYNMAVINEAYYKRYYDSNFIQTGIIFEYCAFNEFKLKFNPRVIVEAFPLPRRGHWTNVAFEILCRKWFLFVMSLPIAYSYEAKKKCLNICYKNVKQFSLSNILIFRSKKYFNAKTIIKNKYFIKQTIHLPYVLLLIISVVPGDLLAFLWHIYKKIKKIFIK